MPVVRLPPGTAAKRKRSRLLPLGKALKKEGMSDAARGEERAEFLKVARGLAYSLACKDPNFEVFADDVRWAIERKEARGYLIPVGVHPGTWGSILRCYLFDKTNQRRYSAHPSNHSRECAVWRLKREYQPDP